MGRLDVGLRLQDVSSSFSSPPSPSTLALLRWLEVVDAAAVKVLDEMPLRLWEFNAARGEATSGKLWPPRPKFSPAAPHDAKKCLQGGGKRLEMRL